jgi:peptidoglycan L-alanyl-D-glutamate endopeptidase CwlK
MAKFSKRSQSRLNSCHKDLQVICAEAIKTLDFSVLEGHRSVAKQQKYFRQGRSKLDGIKRKSKHQSYPSKAVDIAPYPIDFKQKAKSKARFYLLAGVMLQVSKKLLDNGKISHKLRWGGDWDSDRDFFDQSFDDLPHFELLEV